MLIVFGFSTILYTKINERVKKLLSLYTLYVVQLQRKILLAIFSFDGGVAIFFHQFHGIDEITHVFG